MQTIIYICYIVNQNHLIMDTLWYTNKQTPPHSQECILLLGDKRGIHATTGTFYSEYNQFSMRGFDEPPVDLSDVLLWMPAPYDIERELTRIPSSREDQMFKMLRDLSEYVLYYSAIQTTTQFAFDMLSDLSRKIALAMDDGLNDFKDVERDRKNLFDDIDKMIASTKEAHRA